MTLNDLVESVSKLKGWKTVSGAGPIALSIPQSAGRRQVVSLSEFKDDGQAMVRFTTRIGSAENLEPRRLRSALELNIRLPHGCLAVEAGDLVLTETRPLKTTTAETSGDAIEFLARQADQYENLIFKTDVH